MRLLIMLSLFLGTLALHSQSLGNNKNLGGSDRISTLDFVQIQNNNKEEALYYYRNNWLVLRKRAIQEAYIASFELIETKFTPETPYHLILMTTYKNNKQFEQREVNFSKLIKEKGGLRLMNDKQPGDFRKILFGNEKVLHLN